MPRAKKVDRKLNKYHPTGSAWAWAAFLLFDTVVFVLTVYKAFRFGRARKQRLIQMVLRDGAPDSPYLPVLLQKLDCFLAGIMYYACVWFAVPYRSLVLICFPSIIAIFGLANILTLLVCSPAHLMARRPP